MTVGHLNTFFAQVAGNLKSQILKSSNSRRLPGEGMLKFRIDRYVNVKSGLCVWYGLRNNCLDAIKMYYTAILNSNLM